MLSRPGDLLFEKVFTVDFISSNANGLVLILAIQIFLDLVEVALLYLLILQEKL